MSLITTPEYLRISGLAGPARKLRDTFCSHSAAASQTPKPVLGTPLVMGYGDHLDTSRDLSIDDIIGKVPAEDISTRTRLKVGPDCRCACDQRDCAVHFLNERLGHLEAPFKVPFKGVVDFPESFRGKFNLGVAH